MTGRDAFTAGDVAVIRAMLGDLRRADAAAQKAIRVRLRRLGFRISDYATSGLTVAGFDELVRSGRVKVVEGDPREPPPRPEASSPSQGPRRERENSASVPSADEVIEHLVGSEPVPAGEASPPGDLGVYAWWTMPDVLPCVPLTPHPMRPGCGLAYVGIADPAALYDRIVTKHLGGTTGTSSLRKSVAAVLWRQRGWKRRWTAGTERTEGRVVLIHGSNSELTRLLAESFLVTWKAHPAPRRVERTVIELLSPPLNSHHNAGHPFLPALTRLRADFARP